MTEHRSNRPQRRPRVGRPLLPLAALRRLAGLSQSQVARRAGMLPSNVSRAELYREGTVSTTLRYLRALGGTTTLTVSRGKAWITWTRRETTPPQAALPVDMAALDTDTTPHITEGETASNDPQNTDKETT